MDSGTGTKTPHILLLEDDRAHQDLFLRAFRDDPEPFRVSVAGNILDARQVIGRDPPDLIIADWILPDGKGLDILPRRDGKVTIPLVIMTSFGDEQLAVEIMKSGAIDYVVKSATVFRDLPHIARRALREWENIHERIRAKEAVQDSQKRLADIIGFLPDAVLAIDNDGRVIAWNDAIERMTGVVAKDMIGKGDHEYSIPFYGERRPVLIDLVLMEDGEVEKKYDYIQRDERRITSETFIPTLYGGKGAYLWGTASPLFDSAGNRIGAIEVIRNITERRQAEESVREQKAILETLLNAPGDTIALLDRQGTIIDINEAGARRLGGTVQRMTGRCVYDILPPDVARTRKEYIDLVFTTGEPVRFDDARSGAYLHNEIFPVFNPARTVVDHIAIFASDITKQKKTEQALQESETRFKDLFNNMVAGVVIYEPVNGGEDFVFRDINRAVETIEHVRREDLIGQSVLKVFPGVKEFGLFDVFRRVAKTGIPESHPVTKYQDNRISGWRENYIYKLPSGEVVAIYEDMTEMKQVEESERESSRKYAELFELGSEAIFLIDNETGDILETNAAASEMYGYSRDALLTMKNTDLSAEKEDTRNVTTETPQGTIRVPLRYHCRTDGTVFPVEILGRFFTWNKRPVHIAAIRDITERQKAEEELRASREWLGIALSAAHAGTWDWDIPTGMLTWSPEFFELFGVPAGTTASFETWLAALHPDDREPAQAKIDQSIREHTPLWNEYRILLPEGKVRWIGAGGSTVYSDAGEPVRMSGVCIDITNRKLADEKLRESEERYASLFNRSLDSIYIHDLAGNFLDANASALDLLGYSREEISRVSFQSLLGPDELGKAKTAVETIVREGSHSGLIEYHLKRKDGGFVEIETKGTLIVHDGKPSAILGIARDITGRNLAEETLRATETRFRALIQNSSDIIRILDRDGRIVYESPSAERILGYPAGFLIGVNPMEYIHPDDLERVKNDFSEVIDSVNPGTPTEFRIRKADGKYIWVDSIGINLMEVSGVNGIVITTRPIQQRKEAEQALRENEARLATAMDIAGLVNWEFDVATGMFTFDDRFYTLYATTAEREGGNLMSAEVYMQEFVYPEDRPMVLASIRKILATTNPDYFGQMEHRIIPRDGSVRTIIARFAPVMGPDGKVIRTYGANQDITDLKLMEGEIRSLNTTLEQRVRDRTEALSRVNEALEAEIAQRLAAEKKLQASFDEKVTLLKEVHHRVKNNLQIIASLLNLQSRYIKDESSLAVIRESQNRIKAMALVHEKLYRADDISHISLSDYIRFLGTGLFQFYDARSRGIQFILDIHEVNVDIDAAIPLGLIMNELISNSLKYAFPKGRKGDIAISVKKEGHTLTVVYRDTGIGIPAEMDWRNTQSLGLRLVNTLVDQLNGTVELDRSAGTEFTMVLHEKE